MKNRLAALTAIIIVLSCLCACAVEVPQEQQEELPSALPPMVMVDGVLYHGSRITEETPDAQPDGWLTELIGYHEVPTEDGQANFGSEEAPYWYLAEGLCVKIKNEYYVFLEEQE